MEQITQQELKKLKEDFAEGITTIAELNKLINERLKKKEHKIIKKSIIVLTFLPLMGYYAVKYLRIPKEQ